MSPTAKVKWLFKVLILCSMIFSGACSSKKKNDEDDDRAIRGGKRYDFKNLEKYDDKPEISSDGAKAVFLSGRDGEMRVYSIDLSDEESEPIRVTTDEDELEFESEAMLTPDGAWVFMVAASDEGTDIYARAFGDEEAALIRVTEDTAIESGLAVSSDSQLLAYASQAVDGTGTQVGVLQIDSATGPDVTSITTMTTDEDSESQPYWQLGGGPTAYVLYSVKRDPGGYSDVILRRELTVGADITSANEQDVVGVNAARISRDIEFAARNDGLIVVSKNPEADEDGHVDSIKIPGSVTSGKKAVVEDFPSSLGVEGLGNVLKNLGIGTQALSYATDGVGIWVAREVFTCEVGKIKSANSLAVFDEEEDTITRYFVNQDAETDEYGVSLEYCLSEEEEEQLNIDSSYQSVKLNAAATATNFSLLYVSAFTDDMDVWLLKKTGEEFSVRNVSADP